MKLSPGSILNSIYQIQQQLNKRGGRETLLAQNLDYDPAAVEVNWLGQELSQWLDIPLHTKNSIPHQN